jgi:hypothetical protein
LRISLVYFPIGASISARFIPFQQGIVVRKLTCLKDVNKSQDRVKDWFRHPKRTGHNTKIHYFVEMTRIIRTLVTIYVII